MDEAGEGAPSPAPHPNCQTQTSKAEVSTWLRTGTFYLALTDIAVQKGRYRCGFELSRDWLNQRMPEIVLPSLIAPRITIRTAAESGTMRTWMTSSGSG